MIIDTYDGVVEDVGFRSTRIRTLTGHLLTIPNEKIVNSGVENIGKRPHIRWLTNITITYDTPAERVEKAVSIIKDTLTDHEGMHPDFPPRVYFNGFNDWSLNIMVIAWYHPAEYWDMQEWLQRTCLEILGRFNDEGIYIRAELPGVSGDELDIQITANNLAISGERKIAAEEGVKYHRKEREAGTFSRMIGLPGEVNTDKVDANLENGILTVVVPKAEIAKPKQITVSS